MRADTEDRNPTDYSDYTDSLLRSERAGNKRKAYYQDNLSMWVVVPTRDNNLRNLSNLRILKSVL
ncbi:MAG: hypothetical protein JOZ31_04640 [Verrucomicrobia bacterium]|nr:hypothetical protein [Verrucomicrobiota bacterium]MBV8483646.1 hypothetical protein [Verrucomicrobiota bacterium]